MYDKNPPENGGFVSNLTEIHEISVFFCVRKIFLKNFQKKCNKIHFKVYIYMNG